MPAQSKPNEVILKVRKPGKKDSDRVNVPDWVELRVWIKSGGRCAFNGCNKDVYTEDLTLKKQKLGEIAHIVAAQPGGPRGADPLPLSERSKFDNLMLVCRDHHKHFDVQYVDDYPVEVLRKWKHEHESRVEWLLSIGSNAKTKIIRLRGKIGGETAACSETDVREAILPKYPQDLQGIEIDLRTIPESRDDAYWTNCKNVISDALRLLHSPAVSGPPIEHLSIFGFAPIPLLIHLGRSVGNKIPAAIYQRHRDTQNWKWKPSASPAQYLSEKLKIGTDAERVVLILSLSGTVAHSQIPDELLNSCDVYEVKLSGQPPNPGFLNTPEDLERFRAAYQGLLGEIRMQKPDVSEVHLFPAIPIPVAITCGRELLEKAHPCLVVYDRNKKTDKFEYALRVNQ